MANVNITDAADASKFLKATGAGSDGDPFIPQHLETNSAAIKTAVETIDNAIAGSEMQVDVVAALPAGTNAIGKLAANSGVDIGDVDVTSLPALVAGTAHIGAVGASDILVEITPTLDTSAHSAGDVTISETAIANAARASGACTILQSVMVVDKDDQKAQLTLYFFDRTVTFGTKNSAPSISDADAAYYMGHIDIAAADYDDLGGVSVACVKGIGLEMMPNATSIFVAATTSGTPTYTSSGLALKFAFLRS